jgi:predicted MFS family arabinose efflux permease
MTGGYLGNIYNSTAQKQIQGQKLVFDSFNTSSFINVESSKFNERTARFMIVIAVLTMFVVSILSYINNKIIHTFCYIMFNLASLAVIAGLIYLVVVELTEKKTANQTNESFMSENTLVGIIVGSTLAMFAIVSIIGGIVATSFFNSLSGDKIVTIMAIEAIVPNKQKK